MQIRDKLNRIESMVGGHRNLSKLSDNYYNSYVKYLDMLYEEADNLEKLKTEK